MNQLSLNLNRLGLSPMTEFEMENVDGGGFWDRVAGFVGVVASQAAIVVGVVTLNPELVYMGAVGTGLSLDYMNSH